MRTHLYTSLSAVKLGLDILLKEENVKFDKLLGHGGLFKTEVVGQKYLAAAVNAPVKVMKPASEGGAWGMALLASYMVNKEEGEALETFLDKNIFALMDSVTIEPDSEDVEGFREFIKRYVKGIDIESLAVDKIC
ncbi:MAG: FGGY-family carbohydrate kinase [Catonella sp.]|uniref:FGGY-family carbohydrate kinase n=1 Tax=Catonella sp. TaxID=2382125 RepID=UPI003FA0AA36